MTLAVLMPLHETDSLNALKSTIENINSQSLQPDETYIVVDGPVSSQTRAFLEEISTSNHSLVVSFLRENVGLGAALNVGLRNIKSDLIARVDIGDLSHLDRFQLQVSYLKKNLKVAALGSSLYEQKNDSRILVRACENLDLSSVCKYRVPLFHPTVMYRRNLVLEVGGYPEFRKAQDWGLWSRMCANKLKLDNLREPLVAMDVGAGIHKRRGLQQLKYEIKVLSEQRKIGLTSKTEFFQSLILRGALRLSPNFIKRLAYKTFR